MDKLEKRESSLVLPIKALPSDEARSKVVLELGIWLDGLLSLDGEKSVKRLEVLLPMIKDVAWSLSIEEVKKAFTMYVKHELPIEPRDNYLTIILFNKVISEYKKTKTTNKKQIDIDEDKKLSDYNYVINLFDNFVQTDRLLPQCSWVYTYLEHKEVINFSAKEKKLMYKLAYEQEREHESAVLLSKRRLVLRFFRAIHAKGEHIKDYI